MRTTLTLEHDVAVLLDRARKERNMRLKQIVNEALRLGLRQLTQTSPNKEVYRIQPAACRARWTDIDDVAGTLAVLEGEERW